jgi:hypothetical protein
MLISHFELHILPKVSKTVGILAKTHKNVFWLKFKPREVNLPISENTTGLKLELALVSRNIFDAAPCREWIFVIFYTHIFRNSAAPSPRITHYLNLFTRPLKNIVHSCKKKIQTLKKIVIFS